MAVRRIPLRARNGAIRGYAIVDASDFAWLSQWQWSMMRDKKNTYAIKSAPPYRMHRLIMGVTNPKLEVDHKNGNGLDNRRSNLRVCTRRDNSHNRKGGYGWYSDYRGVTWHKRNQKWVARVTVNGVVHHLGCFDREIDAARAARDFRRLHMPFAKN